ncbi:MAG: ABC-2 transporter permease [Oscillibacter sp.]|jgi:hypothetical protein|nr:ABC-2 transporter permease [Oscillibacter sp.]
MRGLIYKDVCLFFKGLDKRIFILVGAVMVLLVINCGTIAGLMASIMLAMTVGIQHTLTFSFEEKVEWEKYQRILPVPGHRIVAGKYAAVVATLWVSVVGSAVFNLAIFAVYRMFSLPLLVFSVVCAVAIPLVWTAVTLPACYWFDFQLAQYVSIVLIFPIFYTVKYFEEGPDEFPLNALNGSALQYVPFAAICIAALFAVSYGISLAGYLWHTRHAVCLKKQRRARAN